MKSRSIANTTISLGLLSIPVKCYTTATDEKFSFTWLSPKGNPVGTKLYDKTTGEELQRSQVSNAFEVEPGKFIVFDDEDIDDLAGDKAGIIEVKEVIHQQIDTSIIERELWLAPDKKADKQYRLLARCLDGCFAVGVWHHRNKDNLVAISSDGVDKLVMFQLYYASELRTIELDFAKNSEPSDVEVELGRKLLKKMSRKGKFELGDYVNGYSDRVVQAASEKYQGLKKSKPGKVERSEGDLVDVLLKSVESEEKGKVG